MAVRASSRQIGEIDKPLSTKGGEMSIHRRTVKVHLVGQVINRYKRLEVFLVVVIKEGQKLTSDFIIREIHWKATKWPFLA